MSQEDISIPVGQAANLVDLTPRRLQQLANEGVIEKDGRGRYNLVKLVRGYVKYLRAQIPGAAVDQNSERARLIRAKAELAELQAAEKAGRLVDADAVQESAYRAARNIRQAFVAMPDRVASEMAVMTDEVKVAERLRKEIDEVLQGLIQLEQHVIDRAEQQLEMAASDEETETEAD